MTDDRDNLPSASSLARIVACPGSPALIKELFGEGTGHGSAQTEDAAFGQDVHGVLSQEVSEMSVPERAAWVAKQCAKIRDRILREIFGEDQDLKMYVETRFWLSDHGGNKVFSAKPDLIAGKNGVFVYLEYKSLTGMVDPVDENHQVLSGCATFADDDHTRNLNGETEVVTCYGAIIQPLLGHKANLVKFTNEDLLRGKRLILQKLDEAKTIGAPRIPGRHCVYCRARNDCPESVSELLAVEKRYNLGVTQLTPQMVANILPHMPALKKRIKDFEAHAKSMAERGELPGYEIKEQAGARYVQGQTAIQGIRNALADWVAKEDVLSIMELPLGPLRERFIEAHTAKERCSKVDSGKAFDELLNEGNLCQRNSPTKRLVRKSEPK